MDRFCSPSNTQRFELEIKRSRFLTTVGHIEGVDAGKAFIKDIRGKYPDANHHCWAMVAGSPDDIYKVDQSDDGEPKGTAGKPILNVLLHAGLGHTIVIVTRYFGGVKLGAGGLVRAYTQSTSMALSKLQTRHNYVRYEALVTLPYTLLEPLEYWIQSTNIEISARHFMESVQLTILVPTSELESLESRLTELGGGAISIKTSI